MVIQYSNDSFGLISSHTLLRILSHAKHPDDYLKLWHEKRSLMTERWDKLFEIEFVQEGKIIDFDIISSKVLEEMQIIYVVIYTS